MIRVRHIAAIALLSMLVFGVACGGDDDASPTPTSSPPATATAPPAATPTPEPLIAIEEPEEGASVPVPVAASGSSNTFEAALTLDLLDAGGDTMCVRHIMATSGSGTPGTWETILAVPPPDAPAAATLRAYEFSAMDGSIINLVERPITLATDRPALFMTAPACGAVFAPGDSITIEGRGVVFEAAFNVELRDASGTALVTERGMAGGTEEQPFTLSLLLPATLPAGAYDLVAFNYSARDGAIENEFPVQIIVQP